MDNRPKHIRYKTFLGSMDFLLWIIFLSPIFFFQHAFAQNSSLRNKINRERRYIIPEEAEAFSKGREFIRIDSTYYVGWLYQGQFLHNRAEDREGYQKAIPLLKKAFVLIEKDFTNSLLSVYNNTDLYIKYNGVYNDYVRTAQALRECYEYTDKPDSAIWVLDHIQAKKFKRDEFGLFGTRAWIIHRNRFYNQKKYSFLKPTVAENEALALKACYDGFGFISQNERQNLEWFGAFASEADRLYIYHYLALIHSYMQRYDSSEYYYNLMAQMGSISWNNYGSLKLEEGQFAASEELYGIAKFDFGSDNRLREPFYYLPLLKVYQGKTNEAIEIAREAIQESPSMPGFGWYNIALARGYLYNGQLDSADITLQKAHQFKEVHIGTTLTQPQYEFTIQLLRLIWYHKKIESIKFLDDGWWYSPSQLYELSALYLKQYKSRYELAGLLSKNPERDRILYDLFCGESTVGFDEIYSVMEDINPDFFSKKMEEKAKQDQRSLVLKYFQLGKANMLLAKNQKKEALKIVQKLLAAKGTDQAFEKLYLGRLLQIQAECIGSEKNQETLNRLFETYPQLIPFSTLDMSMGLQVTGLEDDVTKQIQSDLKKARIHFVSSSSGNVPVLSILFRKKGNKYQVTIDTRSATNKKMVQHDQFVFSTSKDVASEIILRAFGKEGASELYHTES